MATVSANSATAVQFDSRGTPNNRLTVAFLSALRSAGTVYYKSSQDVSASSNDGSLTPGQSITLDRTSKWFIAAAKTDGSTGSATLATSVPAEVALGNTLLRIGGNGELQFSTDHGSSYADVATGLGAAIVANVKDPSYSGGAVGDGVTDDTAAVSSAIAAVQASGGVVFFPPGTYRLTGSLAWPSYVHGWGAGWGKSILSWATDIGTTVPATGGGLSPVALNPNVPGIDASGAGIQDGAPTFRDLQLRGPNTSVTPGVRNVKMDGIKLNSNAKMRDCFVQGFGAGVVPKDHVILDGCKIGNNFFNLLFPSPRESKGNQLALGCNLEGASFACIAAGGDNTIDFCQFVGGNCGNAPYGIYKGDTYNAASTDGFINESHFIDFTFEGIGNAAILDESTGTGSGQDSILSSAFSNPGMVWDPAYKIAGRAADYAVDVRSAANSDFRHGGDGFRTGAVAVYRFRVSGAGCRVELSTIFKADNLVHDTGEGLIVTARDGSTHWCGMVRAFSGTVLQRELLEYDLGGFGQVRRCTGNAFAGVAYQTPSSSRVIVIEDGNAVFTLCESVGPGQYLAPLTATPHHAAPIGSSTAGYPIVGVADQPGGGSGGSATPIVISPRGRV